MKPHTRILIGFGVGTAAGALAHALIGESEGLEAFVANVTEPAGKLFLRALLLTVVPLVFSSLVLGVAGLGDLRRLGRIGGKTLAFTLLVSTIAVGIGLTVAQVVRPGERLDPEVREQLTARYGAKANELELSLGKKEQSAVAAVVELLPENPLASASKIPPDMLGLMLFSVFFGVSLALVPSDKSGPLLAALDGLYEAVATMIRLVMLAAPIGVAALLFTMTARFGFELLAALGFYVACVLGALAFHQFVVYSVLLRVLARVSPIEFFRRTREVMLTAFSTSSSNATLPTAIEATEGKLNVPRPIASFVLTVGATANQNGTALFEGLTILFLAQVFGVELTIAQQLVVLVLAVVSGIGTAGVPAGSIPFVAVVLATIGVPVEGIAIILGVDRLLDMCRTVVNVSGDMACAVWVAQSEGAAVLVPEEPAAPAA